MASADQHPPRTEEYLLGDLGEAERVEYEAHLLECDSCAADLVAADAMVQAVRQLPRERAATTRPGTRPRRWPMAALASVACASVLVTAYQGLVTVPRLHGEIALRDRPRSLAPVLVRPPTRGTGRRLSVGPDDRAFTVSLELPPAARGTPLRAEVQRDGRLVIPPFEVVPPAAGEPLLVQLPVPPGLPAAFTVVLRAHGREETPGGALEIARYPFFLEGK
jgi:hypothetical protein